MTFKHLPPELVDALCGHCTNKELGTLALASSFHNTVSRRHLFQRVSVSPRRRNLDLLDTLAKDPEAAAMVKHFTIDVRSTPLPQGFYTALSVALSRMTQLITLELFIDPPFSWVLHTEPVSRSSRLSRFCTSLAFDSHVYRFLEGTSALLELEIQSSASDNRPHPRPPVTFLPHLAQFVGAADAAEAIVPGRPVAAIQVTSGDLSIPSLERLARSSVPVVALGFYTLAPPLETLRKVVEVFPTVSHLQVMASYGFAEASVTVCFHISLLSVCPEI